MRQVKIFAGTSANDLEVQVNTWLGNNPNIDIEETLYQIGFDSVTESFTFSYIIRYTATA